ncbi:MAG: DHA2 family efflux MFS transporter permease subunit [Acidimicrobiales bacterium]
MKSRWTPEKIHQRRWYTLIAICIAVTITSIDNTIMNVGLPSIVREVGASQAQLQWLIDSYTIVFACLLLTMGAIGDKWGRHRTLIIGLIAFGGFSAIASQADSADSLILCRGLLGIGGALILPATLAILTNTFEGKERSKAIGIWAAVAGIGVAAGPLVGGLLLEHFWWGSIFLINVPICIVAVAMSWFLVPPSKSTETGHRLDPMGAVLSIFALVGLLYGIIEIPEKGWSSPEVLSAVGAGIIFLAAFTWWELHSDHPMLDLNFFRNARFSAASMTITINYFVMFGSTFLIVQYFQFILGYSPLKAGFLTAPVAIGLMVTSPQCHKFVARWGTTNVVIAGLLICSGVMFCYGIETIIASDIGGFFVRLIFGVGLALTATPATESIMEALPRDRAGVGSAVNDTTRQIGGALGVAVIGSLFAWRYHASLSDLSGLPPDAASAAQNSIGKAIAVSKELPTEQATLLLDNAKQAYVSGMRVGVWTCSAILLGAALLTKKFLPSSSRTSEDDRELRDLETEAVSLDDGIL